MTINLHIGILACGAPSEKMQKKHGTYPTMFHNLINNSENTDDIIWRFSDYKIYEHEFPEHPQQCDGWIITGSVYGVYENHAWVKPLANFIRDCYQHHVGTVGICFGHQIIAQALGAKVEKSDKGWGLGTMQYEIIAQPSWLIVPESSKTHIFINAIHQDQIISLPEGKYRPKVFLTSSFCEFAGLYYGDNYMFTMQCHPELNNNYVEDIITDDQNNPIHKYDNDIVEEAYKRLKQDNDNSLITIWITNFFKQNYKMNQ